MIVICRHCGSAACEHGDHCASCGCPKCGYPGYSPHGWCKDCEHQHHPNAYKVWEHIYTPASSIDNHNRLARVFRTALYEDTADQVLFPFAELHALAAMERMEMEG